MYLHHEVVEFLLGELRFLMVGPRVHATHAPVFDAIPIITIAAHVGDSARRTQQVDHQLGVDGGGSLQGWEGWQLSRGQRRASSVGRLVPSTNAARSGGARSSLSRRAMAIGSSLTNSACSLVRNRTRL
eukprot:scaffold5885_cov60-Phaeocystis_antarctica.AAC.4